MQKFQFQLDRVLDFKNQRLDGLVGEHAGIKAEIRREQKMLEDLQKEYDHCSKDMNSTQRAGTSAMNIYIFENYLEVLSFRLKKQNQVLELLYKQEEVKSSQVLEAKKESASIEKLKERRKEEYRKELQKAEEKEIDEFVSNTRRAAR